MFKVQNTKNSKFLKDGISGKVHQFDSFEKAEHFAISAEYYSNVKATAWNSIRPTKYIVVPT